jgi:hypothetical protein
VRKILFRSNLIDPFFHLFTHFRLRAPERRDHMKRLRITLRLIPALAAAVYTIFFSPQDTTYIDLMIDLLGADQRCSECRGTRECHRCFGSGRNTALNSDQDHCRYCAGTGVCPACRDTSTDSSSDSGIITLGLSGR